MRLAPTYTTRPKTSVEIKLFESVETPLGLFYWDPEQMGVSLFAAGFGFSLGLLGGVILGLQTGDPLLGSCAGLVCSVLTSCAFFLRTIRG